MSELARPLPARAPIHAVSFQLTKKPNRRSSRANRGSRRSAFKSGSRLNRLRGRYRAPRLSEALRTPAQSCPTPRSCTRGCTRLQHLPGAGERADDRSGGACELTLDCQILSMNLSAATNNGSRSRIRPRNSISKSIWLCSRRVASRSQVWGFPVRNRRDNPEVPPSQSVASRSSSCCELRKHTVRLPMRSLFENQLGRASP